MKSINDILNENKTTKSTYFFIDKNGDEYVSNELPIRDNALKIWKPRFNKDKEKYSSIILLPKGSIKAITGKSIKWSNEPIKIDVDYNSNISI